MLILDAGSGIVGLGHSLARHSGPIPILLTHYHWDHIQGLPFFAPFYEASCVARIYAPVLGAIDQASVETIFRSPFFPIPFTNLPSRPEVTFVDPRDITIGGFHIRIQSLTHPGGAFAYRISGDSGDVIYATDHEFGNADIDQALAGFALNASAMVLGSHYTPDELPAHKGWGHASWRQSVEFAAANGAGHLWLFHHKPGRTDEELAQIESRARHVFPATTVASEGASFEV